MRLLSCLSAPLSVLFSFPSRRSGPTHTSLDFPSLPPFNRELPLFRGLSFSTISSTGPNASVIHYSPPSEPGTSAIIDPKQIYLCDSGAQFLDGTTECVILPPSSLRSLVSDAARSFFLLLSQRDPHAPLLDPDGVRESRLHEGAARAYCACDGGVSGFDERVSA